MFKDINESIIYCLKAAVDAGELPASTDARLFVKLTVPPFQQVWMTSSISLQ